ncbi:MAG: biotin--[acetyl-CoA-carboxylase] ligase [Candidatus Pelagibacter sp. TMED165]|nr:MAG: biotin--[acetyl-CoA-carboxylase] ligase [Candidatus Pelagibacter sp. TMED165]|tara:strand:- start:172 stop:741 length:570 start_codon:yes stop_codon:yes gene_type:complete
MQLKILKYNSVKSTNEEAIKLIKKNKTKPKIIISKNQTKGKGTMGKKWISKKGNFFATILFELTSKNIKPEEISILNSFLIRDVLKKYTKYKIKVKWPNDLLINSRKLCGILQEVIESNSKKYLIVGIGINTVYAPKSSQFKSISLSQCSNKKIDNKSILNDLKRSYEKLISDIKEYKLDHLKKNICNQ